MTNQELLDRISEVAERIKVIDNSSPTGIIVNKHLSRETIIASKQYIIANPYVATAFHLQAGGDYETSFNLYGVTDDTIEACVFHAKQKVQEVIDNYS